MHLRRDLEHDDTFAQRFEREARLTSALDHPHVVAVTDFGRDPRAGLYLVMELLKGEDLLSRIRSEGALPIPEVLRIGSQTAEAFAYAHGRGLVHRDVKSANIFLVTDDVRKDHAKVLVFGIARMSFFNEFESGVVGHVVEHLGMPDDVSQETAHEMNAVPVEVVLLSHGVTVSSLRPQVETCPRKRGKSNPGVARSRE